MMQEHRLSKPMLDRIVACYFSEVERYMEYAEEVERKLQRHMQDASGACAILGVDQNNQDAASKKPRMVQQRKLMNMGNRNS